MLDSGRTTVGKKEEVKEAIPDAAAISDKTIS
jgi:hypothetical protein